MSNLDVYSDFLILKSLNSDNLSVQFLIGLSKQLKLFNIL